jgi:superfamily II DNA/RNA helicase
MYRRTCSFAAELNAIVDNLPRTRQTLLFSATQTRRLGDLASGVFVCRL